MKYTKIETLRTRMKKLKLKIEEQLQKNNQSSSSKKDINKIAKLERRVSELESIAFKDTLTGIANRALFNKKFLDNNHNFVKDGVLLIIDLNYFKRINDNFGHFVGDKMLFFVAKQLKKFFRTPIRFGGDEFCVIFPEHVSEGAIRERVKKFKESIEDDKNIEFIFPKNNDNKIFDSGKNEITRPKLSCATGYASFKKGESLSSALNLADREMYEDKRKYHETQLPPSYESRKFG